MEDARLTMEPISELNLKFVHPWLAHCAREMNERLSAQSIPIRVVQGLRTWNDQQRDWLKGRDKDGNVTDKKLIVTDAPPGHSWHQFGLAIDVCPIMFLHLKTWGVGKPEWDNVVSVGEGLGLVSGSRWTHPLKDWPHFQLTGKLPVSPDDEVRSLFKQPGGGTLAVWDAADIKVGA